MSTSTPDSGSRSTKDKAKKDKAKKDKAKKVPIWKRDLSSLGKPDLADDAAEEIAHEPFAPVLPHVDLLPAKVRESIRAVKLRNKFVIVGFAMIAVIGVVWFLQTGAIDTANSALAREQSTSATLTAKVQALDPVQRLYTQISTTQSLVETTLRAQPQARGVYDHFDAAAAQSGITQLGSVSITYNGIPKPGTSPNICPDPDPFTIEVTIGCATITGTADNRGQVADFLLAMQADNWFVGPYVTDTNQVDDGGKTTVGFNGTVGLSPDSLKVPLTQEEIAAVTAPPPAPSPSPSPTAAP